MDLLLLTTRMQGGEGTEQQRWLCSVSLEPGREFDTLCHLKETDPFIVQQL